MYNFKLDKDKKYLADIVLTIRANANLFGISRIDYIGELESDVEMHSGLKTIVIVERFATHSIYYVVVKFDDKNVATCMMALSKGSKFIPTPQYITEERFDILPDEQEEELFDFLMTVFENKESK